MVDQEVVVAAEEVVVVVVAAVEVVVVVEMKVEEAETGVVLEVVEEDQEEMVIGNAWIRMYLYLLNVCVLLFALKFLHNSMIKLIYSAKVSLEKLWV